MTTHVLAFAAALAVSSASQPSEEVPPADAPESTFGVYGALAQPAATTGDPVQPPFSEWNAQPGDVVLSDTTTPTVFFFYAFALTGPPAHVGLVARMPDGRLGVIEAGHEGGPSRTRFTPLDVRLRQYPRHLWVRRRTTPLTEEQSARLTEFAANADGGRYALWRAAGQTFALVRTRGPVRTYHFGHPNGERPRYFCGELVLEALVHVGALDAETTRPSAVFPRDLFYDTSSNLYLREHPPLGNDGWEPPARWVPPPPPGPVITFHGPYLTATVAAGPNPTPDALAGAPPYLTVAPAALGYELPAPTPVAVPAASKSEEPPTPLRFGPTGVPPRLGPGPGS